MVVVQRQALAAHIDAFRGCRDRLRRDPCIRSKLALLEKQSALARKEATGSDEDEKTKTHRVRRQFPWLLRCAERRSRGITSASTSSVHREGAGLAGRACRVLCGLAQALERLAVAAALWLPNPRCYTVVTVVAVILAVRTWRPPGAAHFGFVASIACRSKLGQSVGHGAM